MLSLVGGDILSGFKFGVLEAQVVLMSFPGVEACPEAVGILPGSYGVPPSQFEQLVNGMFPINAHFPVKPYGTVHVQNSPLHVHDPASFRQQQNFPDNQLCHT